jgi:hypothetical protein
VESPADEIQPEEAEPTPAAESAGHDGEFAEEPTPHIEPPPKALPPPPPRRLIERVSRVPAAQPAEPTAVSAAVSEVEKVVEALKRAAEQMEEVLELVELAERQKLADERELDSLRRALNRLHRPDEGGRRDRH